MTYEIQIKIIKKLFRFYTTDPELEECVNYILQSVFLQGYCQAEADNDVCNESARINRQMHDVEQELTTAKAVLAHLQERVK